MQARDCSHLLRRQRPVERRGKVCRKRGGEGAVGGAPAALQVESGLHDCRTSPRSALCVWLMLSYQRLPAVLL
jgi:hypothetical protein